MARSQSRPLPLYSRIAREKSHRPCKPTSSLPHVLSRNWKIPQYCYPDEAGLGAGGDEDQQPANQAIWFSDPEALTHYAYHLDKVISLYRSGLEEIEVLLTRYDVMTGLLRNRGTFYLFSYCVCVEGSERPYLWRINAPNTLQEILKMLESVTTMKIKALKRKGFEAEMVPFWSKFGGIVDHEVMDKVIKKHYEMHSEPEIEDDEDQKDEFMTGDEELMDEYDGNEVVVDGMKAVENEQPGQEDRGLTGNDDMDEDVEMWDDDGEEADDEMEDDGFDED